MTQPVQNPNAVPVDQPPPKLFAVALMDNEMWQLGGFVPGSTEAKSRGTNPQDPASYGREIDGTEGREALRIVDMIPNEDGSVDVYAAPVPGSEFDRQQTAAIFTLYPQTIRRTLTVARFDTWKQELAAANAPDDDDDDDDDDDEEVPEAPAAALPATNGAPVLAGGATS